MKQLLTLLPSWSGIETPYEEAKYTNFRVLIHMIAQIDYGQLPGKDLESQMVNLNYKLKGGDTLLSNHP